MDEEYKQGSLVVVVVVVCVAVGGCFLVVHTGCDQYHYQQFTDDESSIQPREQQQYEYEHYEYQSKTRGECSTTLLDTATINDWYYNAATAH